MRGLPGSGKSTEARKLAAEHIHKCGSSVAICSTDRFFMESGEYVFNRGMLGQYHELNQDHAEECMRFRVELVIIDNTNIKHRDMKPYKDIATKLGYEIEEIIIDGDALPWDENYIGMCVDRNTHGVPREAIEKMAQRFQI